MVPHPISVSSQKNSQSSSTREQVAAPEPDSTGTQPSGAAPPTLSNSGAQHISAPQASSQQNMPSYPTGYSFHQLNQQIPRPSQAGQQSTSAYQPRMWIPQERNQQGQGRPEARMWLPYGSNQGQGGPQTKIWVQNEGTHQGQGRQEPRMWIPPEGRQQGQRRPETIWIPHEGKLQGQGRPQVVLQLDGSTFYYFNQNLPQPPPAHSTKQMYMGLPHQQATHYSRQPRNLAIGDHIPHIYIQVQTNLMRSMEQPSSSGIEIDSTSPPEFKPKATPPRPSATPHVVTGLYPYAIPLPAPPQRRKVQKREPSTEEVSEEMPKTKSTSGRKSSPKACPNQSRPNLRSSKGKSSQ